MATAAVLLVFSPTNNAIESAAKFLIANKDPASCTNEQEKEALQAKQLLVKTEKDLQRFLDVVKQCDSDELGDLVCSAPTNSRTPIEIPDPTLHLLNDRNPGDSSEVRYV